MNRRRSMPVIEGVHGQPQQPLADLYNRPRNSGPSFPFVTARQLAGGVENEPPLPPTRPNTPVHHVQHLPDPLLPVTRNARNTVPILLVRPYNPFEDFLEEFEGPEDPLEGPSNRDFLGRSLTRFSDDNESTSSTRPNSPIDPLRHHSSDPGPMYISTETVPPDDDTLSQPSTVSHHSPHIPVNVVYPFDPFECRPVSDYRMRI